MQSNLRTYTHDWTARDIVAHLVGWFTEFLGAGGVALPVGPPVTDDPLAAWAAHAAAVQGLLDSDAHLAMGHSDRGRLAPHPHRLRLTRRPT